MISIGEKNRSLAKTGIIVLSVFLLLLPSLAHGQLESQVPNDQQSTPPSGSERQAPPNDPNALEPVVQPAQKGRTPEVYCWIDIANVNIGGCIMIGIAWIGWILMSGASWLLWAVGHLFNYVLWVQNQAFHDQPIVNRGWQITRDVSNIFFIFVMLIISIGTILRFESYGMKTLLPRLVIVALLINFSLPIAGVVIDVANTLGNTFYDHMGDSGDSELQALGGKGGREVRDISTAMMTGLNPQKALKMNTAPLSQQLSGWDQWLNFIISVFAGTALILIAAFVLAVGIGMLLFRIIQLWLLLIFAPLAFLAAILPETQTYFQTWRHNLFSQSFFYPAYMFMLYLAVTAVSSDTITTLFNTNPANLAKTFNSQQANFGATEITSSVMLILSYVFLGMLFLTALTVAKSMGAKGADVTAKYIHTGRKWATGHAGRLSNKYVGQYASRAGMAVTSPLARGKYNPLRPFVRPFVRALNRPLAASVQKAEGDERKRAQREAAMTKNLAPKQMAQMFRTLSVRGKAEAWRTMGDKKKEMVKNLDKNEAIAFGKQMQTAMKRIDPSVKYDREMATASGDTNTAMKILHNMDQYQMYTDEQKKEYQRNFNNFLQSLDLLQRQNFITADNLHDNEYVKNYVINKFTMRDIGNASKDPKQILALHSLLTQGMSGGENSQMARENGKLYKQLNSGPGIRLLLKLSKMEVPHPEDYGDKVQRGKEDKPKEEDSTPKAAT